MCDRAGADAYRRVSCSLPGLGHANQRRLRVAQVGLAGDSAAGRDRRPHDEVLELPAPGPGGGVQVYGERGRAVVRGPEAVGGGRLRGGLQLEHAGDGAQPVGLVQKSGGVLGPGRVVFDGHHLHALLAPPSSEQRLEPRADATVSGHQRQPLGAPAHQEVGHLQPDVVETAYEHTPR